MTGFVTTFDELAELSPERMVVLYSGGVDGTFLLRRLQELGTDVTALNVGIGDGESVESASAHAARYGARLRHVDVSEQFFEQFLPPAIHADAVYQDLFPVSSSLTRPLMAQAAVQVARELDCHFVGHTATYMQNSAMRLTASLAALDPDLGVAAPFLGSDVPRADKLAVLAADGIEFAEGIHSIDANPWARVIECGSLEDPENLLDEEVFRWTADPARAPAEGVELDLELAGGIPVALDGVPMSLRAIVESLNRTGGRHGVGRSSGLEDTAFGVKNHEVREAPAATVIIKAHQVLANAVLTQREHSVRAGLAREWTADVVAGGWFGVLAQSLGRCLADLDRPVSGVVRLRLARGALTVLQVHSAHGLYYSRLGQDFHDQMQRFSYTPWLTRATWAQSTRRSEMAP